MQGSFSRRTLLQSSGLSLGSAALSSLLARDLTAAPSADITLPRDPHFAPKAKHIIYLHMIGAPSQLDLFDYKPELIKRSGQPCPPELLEGKRFAFIGTETALQGTPFQFKQHGQSGAWISELLPHLATVADDDELFFREKGWPGKLEVREQPNFRNTSHPRVPERGRGQ